MPTSYWDLLSGIVTLPSDAYLRSANYVCGWLDAESDVSINTRRDNDPNWGNKLSSPDDYRMGYLDYMGSLEIERGG